jgi:fructokinase
MIATIGEALVDMIETPGGGFTACLGGSVCNLTLGLARQAISVTYLSPLSGDRFGHRFAALLRSAGVAHASAKPSTCPTSLAIVALDQQGVPTYAFYRDNVADRDISAADLVDRLPSGLTVLHTGGLALVPADSAKISAVMRAAAEQGALISIDANLRPVAVDDHASYFTWVQEAMQRAHIVKVSDEDLAILGLAGLTHEEVANRLFAGSVTECVALTLGPRGAILFTRTARIEMAAPANLAVVDTVGAGDSFHAGFLASLQRAGALCDRSALAGTPLSVYKAALRHAIASASMNLLSAGATPPTWDQAVAFAANLTP